MRDRLEVLQQWYWLFLPGHSGKPRGLWLGIPLLLTIPLFYGIPFLILMGSAWMISKGGLLRFIGWIIGIVASLSCIVIGYYTLTVVGLILTGIAGVVCCIGGIAALIKANSIQTYNKEEENYYSPSQETPNNTKQNLYSQPPQTYMCPFCKNNISFGVNPCPYCRNWLQW